jgi:hypothetical protein
MAGVSLLIYNSKNGWRVPIDHYRPWKSNQMKTSKLTFSPKQENTVSDEEEAKDSMI